VKTATLKQAIVRARLRAYASPMVLITIMTLVTYRYFTSAADLELWVVIGLIAAWIFCILCSIPPIQIYRSLPRARASGISEDEILVQPPIKPW
jgi:hypothetical protein